METKQISNYLVKLDGFKSEPDFRYSNKNEAHEMWVLLKMLLKE